MPKTASNGLCSLKLPAFGSGDRGENDVHKAAG